MNTNNTSNTVHTVSKTTVTIEGNEFPTNVMELTQAQYNILCTYLSSSQNDSKATICGIAYSKDVMELTQAQYHKLLQLGQDMSGSSSGQNQNPTVYY